ncbi:MAG: squalene--hopene cyclase [Planctomycetota bacterium]|nr:squalene--hopene cyclase [Planctomycetota bacterium]
MMQASTDEKTTITKLRESLARGVAALRHVQNSDGHWCAELEGDSILESEYILMKFILRLEDEPFIDGSGRERLEQIAKGLRDQQRPSGEWGQYPGSGMDLNGTVKAYFALKLMGDDPDAPHMTKARDLIRKAGGAERCNTFSMFYLASLGQVPWSAVPAIPPEIVLLPRWSYFHLTKISAWTRAMILPLAMVTTLRPTRTLTREQGIDELFVDERERRRLTYQTEAPRFWQWFFRTVDRGLKGLHHIGGTPFRRKAMRDCLAWILRRASQGEPAPTDGVAAIFPSMVYIQVLLDTLGWPRDHEVRKRAERDLDDFFLVRKGGQSIKIQPCLSPVWDTGIALYAMTEAGLDERDPSVRAATEWLRGKECRFKGDWAETVSPSQPTSSWYFEYANAWYPDVDDTAMVAMALYRAGGKANQAAGRRGVEWMLAMQNEDGGWAAFDKTQHRQILEYIPFADHNAMQDPSCSDITGRCLECLSWYGFTLRDERVRQAVEYVRRTQTSEGAWIGRWGVNYIYGTWQALVGPIRCGVQTSEDWVQRAGNWLRSVQKSDGSFGESPDSYIDPSLKGIGPSTASQTAWAAMTLHAIYGAQDPGVQKALGWLVSTQLSDEEAEDSLVNPDGDPAGSWSESWFTGTGFPKAFYMRYHLYRLYFPVMALARILRDTPNCTTGVEPVQRMRPKVKPISDTYSERAGALEDH